MGGSAIIVGKRDGLLGIEGWQYCLFTFDELVSMLGSGWFAAPEKISVGFLIFALGLLPGH